MPECVILIALAKIPPGKVIVVELPVSESSTRMSKLYDLTDSGHKFHKSNVPTHKVGIILETSTLNRTKTNTIGLIFSTHFNLCHLVCGRSEGKLSNL